MSLEIEIDFKRLHPILDMVFEVLLLNSGFDIESFDEEQQKELRSLLLEFAAQSILLNENISDEQLIEEVSAVVSEDYESALAEVFQIPGFKTNSNQAQ